MTILEPTKLETADYGQQGWNAIFSANFEKINEMLKTIEKIWDKSAANNNFFQWKTGNGGVEAVTVQALANLLAPSLQIAGIGDWAKPQAAAGVGQWRIHPNPSMSAGIKHVLPSGGTWAWFSLVGSGHPIGGVAAGGTQINVANIGDGSGYVPFEQSQILCWRIG